MNRLRSVSLKPKKCKFKGCDKMLTFGQGFKVPMGWFCTFDHASAHGSALSKAAAKRKKAKALAKQGKANSKALRALNRRTKSWQHKQCKPVFNKLRRLLEFKWFKERGLEPTCISCDRPNMDWCCGHMKTVGAQSVLRYDFMNTYLQCNMYCNKNLSGNIGGTKTTRGFKQGLRERFGEQEGNMIINYCETHTDPGEWDCEELQAMRADWNKQIRELENALT